MVCREVTIIIPTRFWAFNISGENLGVDKNLHFVGYRGRPLGKRERAVYTI